MKVPFINLAKQYSSIKDEIDEAIGRVLERGWFVLGAEVEAFEREFSAYCGVKYAIGTGSGTEALHLALLALGIEPGDEVITVANISAPTVAAICFAGAKPAFVDIDPETFNLDPDRLESYLRQRKAKGRVRAVIPVHLYGQAADMDPILETAAKYGLSVIEDACQAHGSEYQGKKAGNLGDAACFSFYPTKNLGAYGDGGIVVTNSGETAEKLRMLRNYGEKSKYYNVIRGFNSRLDEIQAAVLRVKLKHLYTWNGRRRRIASMYSDLLAGTLLKLPVEKSRARHIYHLYVVRSDHREELKHHLEISGIGTSIHYPLPLHLQPAYHDLGYRKGDFPETEQAALEVLSLPMYPELETEEIEYICRAIRDWI